MSDFSTCEECGRVLLKTDLHIRDGFTWCDPCALLAFTSTPPTPPVRDECKPPSAE